MEASVVDKNSLSENWKVVSHFHYLNFFVETDSKHFFFSFFSRDERNLSPSPRTNGIRWGWNERVSYEGRTAIVCLHKAPLGTRNLSLPFQPFSLFCDKGPELQTMTSHLFKAFAPNLRKAVALRREWTCVPIVFSIALTSTTARVCSLDWF